MEIEWQLNEMVLRPLVLLISNLNQQGYNFTLTPNAKSNDGNLDMVYIKKINIFLLCFNPNHTNHWYG